MAHLNSSTFGQDFFSPTSMYSSNPAFQTVTKEIDVELWHMRSKSCSVVAIYKLQSFPRNFLIIIQDTHFSQISARWLILASLSPVSVNHSPAFVLLHIFLLAEFMNFLFILTVLFIGLLKLICRVNIDK